MLRRQRGGDEVQLYSFLTSSPDGVGGQRNVLAALTPGKIAGTHCTKDRSGRVWKGENLLSPLVLEPRIVQPAVSRYPGPLPFTAAVKDTGEVTLCATQR